MIKIIIQIKNNKKYLNISIFYKNKNNKKKWKKEIKYLKSKFYQNMILYLYKQNKINYIRNIIKTLFSSY